VAPIALGDDQLAQIMAAAQPIPPCLRGEYLALVARALSGRTFGDGDVHRACREAAKQVMWNVKREAV
jgi:hypothetical protein